MCVKRTKTKHGLTKLFLAFANENGTLTCRAGGYEPNGTTNIPIEAFGLCLDNRIAKVKQRSNSEQFHQVEANINLFDPGKRNGSAVTA